MIPRMVGQALLRIPARNIAARSISTVMQPTVTIIPLLALFNGLHEPHVTLARWLVWSCATITCATTLPSLLFLIMLKRGTIADLHVSNRSERPLAYAVMILCYVLGTEVARAVAAPHRTVLLMAAMTLCLMIGSAVNEFVFKFSIHTMSAALAVVALAMVYGVAFLPALVVIGAVAWARVRLQAHTVQEVLAGAIAGGLVGTLVFALL
jgi:membrane-associated phospholipid phosphatase